jgi:hypothetical protein
VATLGGDQRFQREVSIFLPAYESRVQPCPTKGAKVAKASKMKCSICEEMMDEWPGGGGYGNNAWPVNEGRCCDDCNARHVIPERFARMAKSTGRYVPLSELASKLRGTTH